MTSQVRVRSMLPGLQKCTLLKIVWIGAVGAFVLAVGQSFTTVSHAQAAGTVWDGVYTDAQATRGTAVFSAECAACHGEKGEGTGMAPGLTGPDFMTDFAGGTVADLFSRISKTMPANDPGKLKPAQVADIVAFLAKVNMWPAGQKELASDETALKAIKVVKK